MALTREQMYEIDQAEQTQFIMEEGVVKGWVNSIECFLRTRFPDEFVSRYPSLNSKLYEKPLPILESLAPLSASCASLSEFMQKL